MIERADADHDGFVSEEEFYNLLTKKYWLWLMLWSFKNFMNYSIQNLISNN